ncbi:MAG TPA: sensor domain-containing diguanylate cyclase [Candidatus Limnocylindria bacterium]|nr:sensor domain-containing diguanylate cyclase [Candidatus Limnocylindria bacterium]
MDRSAAVRVAGGASTLLLGLLAVAGIVLLRAAPPIVLADHGMAWVIPVLAAALVVTAALAAVIALVDGLRHNALAPILDAGAAGALAGGALVAVAGRDAALAVLAAASLTAAATLVRDVRYAEARVSRLAAVGVMVIAELAAVVGLVADLGAIAPALLGVAALVSGAAAVAREDGRDSWTAALMAIGAAGLLADRSGSVEGALGLGALVASQVVALTRWVDAGARGTDASDEERLPALAERLDDAVLRFDGSLRLRDWNAAATALLGLDTSSAGQRADDLLGVSIAELPSDDSIVTTRRGVGSLEIAMHRSGAGVTALIRDPGATPEAERLADELRSTIEELLRARRTVDLQRGELERSATIDPMTGVASRAAILERLRSEVAMARRYRHPLALVLLDVDRFGEVNAEHGIAAGDAVLREVALRFRLRVREADALGRFGSDGFVAALPHTDEAGAATFADALRHRLALRPVAAGEVEVPITVSIGVATMRPGEDLEVDGLLARVSEALDSARSAGGDRIALDRLHGFVRLEDPHAQPPTPDASEESGA